MNEFSRFIDTPIKRLFIVIISIMSIIMMTALVVNTYYRFYIFLNDEEPAFFCHRLVAERELDSGDAELFSEAHRKTFELIKKRLKNRNSAVVEKIEQSHQFKQCMKSGPLEKFFAHKELSFETALYIFYAMVVSIIFRLIWFSLQKKIRSAYYWILMK